MQFIGSTYQGQTTTDKKRFHGLGQYTFPNGDRYVGGMYDGAFHGHGVVFYRRRPAPAATEEAEATPAATPEGDGTPPPAKKKENSLLKFLNRRDLRRKPQAPIIPRGELPSVMGESVTMHDSPVVEEDEVEWEGQYRGVWEHGRNLTGCYVFFDGLVYGGRARKNDSKEEAEAAAKACADWPYCQCSDHRVWAEHLRNITPVLPYETALGGTFMQEQLMEYTKQMRRLSAGRGASFAGDARRPMWSEVPILVPTSCEEEMVPSSFAGGQPRGGNDIAPRWWRHSAAKLQAVADKLALPTDPLVGEEDPDNYDEARPAESDEDDESPVDPTRPRHSRRRKVQEPNLHERYPISISDGARLLTTNRDEIPRSPTDEPPALMVPHPPARPPAEGPHSPGRWALHGIAGGGYQPLVGVEHFSLATQPADSVRESDAGETFMDELHSGAEPASPLSMGGGTPSANFASSPSGEEMLHEGSAAAVHPDVTSARETPAPERTPSDSASSHRAPSGFIAEEERPTTGKEAQEEAMDEPMEDPLDEPMEEYSAAAANPEVTSGRETPVPEQSASDTLPSHRVPSGYLAEMERPVSGGAEQDGDLEADAEDPDAEEPMEEPMEDPLDEPMDEPMEDPMEEYSAAAANPEVTSGRETPVPEQSASDTLPSHRVPSGYLAEMERPVSGGAEQDGDLEADAEDPGAEEPMDEPMDEPMEDPMDEPMEDPMDEPMEEYSAAAANPEVTSGRETPVPEQSASDTLPSHRVPSGYLAEMERPVSGGAEQDGDLEADAEDPGAEEPMDEPMDEPMEDPMDEPMEDPLDEPMEEYSAAAANPEVTSGRETPVPEQSASDTLPSHRVPSGYLAEMERPVSGGAEQDGDLDENMEEQ